MDLFAGFLSCFFEDGALLADDDAFLRITLDVDRAADVDLAIFTFMEFFCEYADGVRHFIACARQELFTDDLLHDVSLRLVGHHVIGEVFRAFGQVLFYHLHEDIQILSRLGRERDDLGKLVDLIVLHELLQELVLGDQVRFRQRKDDRHLAVLQEGNDVTVACAQRIVHGAEEDDEVDLVQSVHGILTDHFAELALRLVHAGGVQKDHLGILAVPYAGDLISGRLCVSRHDGNLFPQKGIHKCGFTDIRPPDKSDKAGVKFGFVIHRVS